MKEISFYPFYWERNQDIKITYLLSGTYESQIQICVTPKSIP